MKLLVDDARIDKIKAIYEYYSVDGVTTNPTILSRNGREPYKTLKEIREFIGSDADLHVQVISQDAAGMIAEAPRQGTPPAHPERGRSRRRHAFPQSGH